MRGEYNTKQKQEMTRFLAEHAMQSFSAEELVGSMEKEGVRVGHTTAYRFLEALCQQRAARKYLNAQGLARYQYLGEDADCDHHFHMMCRQCGDMFHVDCEMVSRLGRHMRAEHGFAIEPRESVLVGLCENCLGGKRDGCSH